LLELAESEKLREILRREILREMDLRFL